jgi:U3 small nucleolar RNA-associated protein 14
LAFFRAFHPFLFRLLFALCSVDSIDVVKAGWGDWAGPGATGISQKTLKTRDRLMKKVEQESEEKRAERRDTKTPNVILSDRRVKTAAKYKIEEIPHPYTSREEYERAMQMPLGGESLCRPCRDNSCFLEDSAYGVKRENKLLFS